jgi:hypothetical protein
MSKLLIGVAHGIVGWALCGATMGIGMAVTSLRNALVIHALAAPVIFAALAWFYHKRFDAFSPPRTAALFLATVIALDVLIVAMVIEGSFEMFASLAGTWLPFALLFVAAWAAGVRARGGLSPRRGPAR